MRRLQRHARWVHALELLFFLAIAVAVVVDGWRGGLGPVAPQTVPAPDLAESVQVPQPEPAPAGASPAKPAIAASDTAALAALRERRARSSLRGTQRDGDYTLAADGRLVLDTALVRVFDYWLTLAGEWPDADIRALLLADARAAHGDALAAQVAAAFDRYLGLRSQLASTSLSADLAERLEQLRAARRAWFGAEAEAMFGAEEAAVAYTLERQRLETADLAPDERLAALDALERDRPAAARMAQTEASAALVADEQARQFDTLDTDPAQRQSEREALWGREAAQRLARLDAARADWDRRIADYLRDRAGLTGNEAASLRAARFTPEERARIEALEAIGALGAPAPGG